MTEAHQAAAGVPTESDAATQDETEVRPEELTRGIERAPWESPLPEQAVEALRQPLDPNRVRRRKGRGTGQFEYLAGHDAKRRANEIFGFGNWGYTVVDLQEIAAVEVESDTGKPGWHIAYMAVVEVNVRGCPSFSDVGYGDGVEYVPAARATARELAMKEAVTDGMKRALTAWGDQFGLILYAKGDEKQRIDRERNREQTGGEVRQERAGRDERLPGSWTELRDRWANLLDKRSEQGFAAADAWIRQAVDAKHPGKKSADLNRTEKAAIFQTLAGALLTLESNVGDFEFATGVRKTVATEFAARLGGVELAGPPWRLGPEPEEDVYPTFDEWKAIDLGQPEAEPGQPEAEPAAAEQPAADAS
jgi:DNA recombination protein Rad52